MDPVKSVSGFIGIGEHVKYNPYTCRLCDMKDCIYRRRQGLRSSTICFLFYSELYFVELLSDFSINMGTCVNKNPVFQH